MKSQKVIYVCSVILLVGVAALTIVVLLNRAHEVRAQLSRVEARNEGLRHSVGLLSVSNRVLAYMVDCKGGPKEREFRLYAAEIGAGNTKVLQHIQAFETLANENRRLLTDGQRSYPVMVQTLGAKLREIEDRLEASEAKLLESSQHADPSP